jgi:hypothetical protein
MFVPITADASSYAAFWSRVVLFIGVPWLLLMLAQVVLLYLIWIAIRRTH